jgi:hypothetical protein
MEGQFENIKFQTNVPLTVALKFAEGKPVQSQFNGEDQVLFTCTDGRRMYLSPYAAQKIEALNPRAGERITITKKEVVRGNRRGIEWEAARAAEREPAPLAADQQTPQQRIPAAAAETPAPTTGNNTTSVSATTKLEWALKTVVHAAYQAEQYAQKIGYTSFPRFTSEDIRTMANTLLINQSKEQR